MIHKVPVEWLLFINLFSWKFSSAEDACRTDAPTSEL